MKKRLLGVMISGVLLSYSSYGQTSVNSSGGDASGSSGTAGYSVGQTFYVSSSSSAGSESPGIQHPFDISLITDVSEDFGGIGSVDLYPNPTLDYVTVSFPTASTDLTLRLYDALGKVKTTTVVSGNETVLPMSEYEAGTYLLKIYSAELQVKEYQIIKL